MVRQRMTARKSVTLASLKSKVKTKIISPMSMAVNVPVDREVVYERLMSGVVMPTTWKEAMALLTDVKYVRFRPT